MSRDADWFAAKLAGNKTTEAPRYNPGYVLPSTHVVPSQPHAQPQTKAQSARLTDTCPGCFGDNYFRPSPNSGYRCYDCGYPLVQSGSGVSTVNDDGPTRPARQVQTAGFNPVPMNGSSHGTQP